MPEPTTHSRARPLAAAILVAAGLSLGLGACGDDDEATDEAATTEEATTEDAASAEAVTLTATDGGGEYDFELSTTPTAETETVTATNDGEEFHVMIFARINEGFTTEEAIELEGEKGSAEIVAEAEMPPGSSEEVQVKGPLEPGPYAMLCPVSSGKGEPPHYKLGQLEEFEIE